MSDHAKQLTDLQITIQPLLEKIRQHPTFTAIHSIIQLRKFAEIHVYAVWDFMCLLKALQRKITHANLLWLPPADAEGCRLINTLVTEEESDHIADNRFLSHFELYVEAMQQSGAPTEGISAFLKGIKRHISLDIILNRQNIPAAAKSFITDTFTVIQQEAHIVAASFAFARENITEGMFTAILENIAQAEQMPQENPNYSVEKFLYYFQRHIDLDGGKHQEQSQTLVANLCGTDLKKWHEAIDTAVFSLESRIRLLDGIYTHITTTA